MVQESRGGCEGVLRDCSDFRKTIVCLSVVVVSTNFPNVFNVLYLNPVNEQCWYGGHICMVGVTSTDAPIRCKCICNLRLRLSKIHHFTYPVNPRDFSREDILLLLSCYVKVMWLSGLEHLNIAQLCSAMIRILLVRCAIEFWCSQVNVPKS